MASEPEEDEPSRGRRRWFVVTLAFGAVVVLLVAVVGYRAMVVRAAGAQAREALAEGLAALEEGDLATARARLVDVDRAVGRAQGATDTLVWGLVEHVPVAGRSLTTASRAVDAAEAATDVADVLVGALDLLSTPEGTTRIRLPDGRIDFEPIEEAAAMVAALDTAPLAVALDELRALPGGWVPPVVREGRAVVLEQSGQLLDVARDARALADVMPSFLGADGPREYLMAMQNPAEVRGTGGLIGFFATIRIERGQITLSDPEKYEVLDAAGDTAEAEGATPPVLRRGLPEGFAERYDQYDSLTFLANVNFDPDLPSVATALLNLFELERGRRPDGVIVMDPLGLAFAHGPVGDVVVPDELAVGGMPARIPPTSLSRLLMIHAYDRLGGPTPARKAYMAAVAESAFRGITSGRWSAPAMMRALASASSGGHVQVFSTRGHEQETFEALDVAGSLEVPEGMDLMALTANNAAGNKMDVHVAHRVRGTVRLDPRSATTARRHADLEISLANPLPTEGRDLYIIGSHAHKRGFVEPFTGPMGLNRTWFTLWTPASDDDFAITNWNGRHRPDPRVHRVRDVVGLDYTLETPSRSQRSFGLEAAGPVPVESRADGTVRYRLRLHRQAKAVPDRLDLRFEADDGWRVRRATVTGGGPFDPAFGIDGDTGPAVAVSVADGAATLTGDMLRDVTLEIVLEPAE